MRSKKVNEWAPTFPREHLDSNKYYIFICSIIVFPRLTEYSAANSFGRLSILLLFNVMDVNVSKSPMIDGTEYKFLFASDNFFGFVLIAASSM